MIPFAILCYKLTNINMAPVLELTAGLTLFVPENMPLWGSLVLEKPWQCQFLPYLESLGNLHATNLLYSHDTENEETVLL